MRKSGQITVFLSLVLLCIFSLMCGLIESARTAGARWYLKMAADSAMDSVFSMYHKEAWDKYRLILLECKNNDEIENAWREYMEPYMENSGWYTMELEAADASNTYITDQDGELIKKEILDYMKFGIFENLPDENNADALLKNLNEAGKVNELSESYSSHTREAVQLEEALENINNCLNKQKKYWQRANERIKDYDGDGFQGEADKLLKEINKISSLVNTYEKRADELKISLEKTNNKLSESSGDLSVQMQKAMKENTDCYESYINKEGERRKEIEVLPEKMEEIKTVIKRAKKRSNEVEKIISDWEEKDNEEDNDDDAPDYDDLWGSVEDIWNDVTIPQLYYSNGVKDTQKQKLLENLLDIVQSGILKLVIPEGMEVSKGTLDASDFPSKNYIEGKINNYNLLDQLVFEEYCGRFLTCFVSDEDKEVKYELEYLIGGKKTDKQNLEQVVTQLLMVREGLNLIHILSDSEKRQEAMTLASTITGATGTILLSGVVAFFIMSVWALGESVVDVKMLLEGKKVSFIKTKENWNLSLENLLNLAESGTSIEGKEDSKGINYMGYVKLLLFATNSNRQYYRLMDVIQMNICREQDDFRMAHCTYKSEIVGTVKAKHLFFGGNAPYYPMTVKTEKAY